MSYEEYKSYIDELDVTKEVWDREMSNRAVYREMSFEREEECKADLRILMADCDTSALRSFLDERQKYFEEKIQTETEPMLKPDHICQRSATSSAKSIVASIEKQNSK